MEYMNNFKSIKTFAQTSTTEDKSIAGNHIFEFVMELLIGHGIYYSDSHYGNYLVNDKNEICVLDFGCIDRFDEERTNLIRRMLKAGIDDDKEELIKTYTDLGVINEDMDREVIDYAYTMNEVVTRPFRVPNFEFTKEYVLEVASTETDTMGKWNLPKGLVYLQKIPWSLYAMLSKLEVTVTGIDKIYEKYLKDL
jgi:predicted unusual protein kinase regulating ubiquinone biosynthesis (AarF/ABC1/UbiB family)